MVLPEQHINPNEVSVLSRIKENWPCLDSIVISQKKIYENYWLSILYL